VTTVVKVLAGSGAFILAATGIYWFVSYETAGTVLLLGTGLACLVIAGYVWLRNRRARAPAPEDRADADPGEGAGEAIASFTADSPWPLVFGVGVAVFAGGLVFGFPLLIVGGVLVVVGVVGMMRESIA
jgi:cytochrome c oxidase subunit IV